jgi:DNA helicase-2/ATP-dependent DNA helicase PcrA
MKFVADLHLHSHYSRATSKNLNFEHLSKWAQLKGVHVVGTGDIAHPGWLQEMKDKLEPAEEGLFRLKDASAKEIESEVPQVCQAPVRFMLAGEISSIYKKNDKVRKVHNVIFAPTLESVEKIQAALEKIGNIRSDGRPILGLDSRDLLEIILDIDEQNYLIPAHIWTPWFSLLGSKSGFDSVEECFEDLTPQIFAMETGLSSDPPMNWRVSALDRYTLVSNSDAHSPQKLAREANLFDTELSYPAIFEALKGGDPNTFLGTVEFFPEEGKYHYDGHRKCEIRWDPKVTLAHHGLCSHCGKPVTVGVMHRVEMLADRTEGDKPARTHPFQSLIPLPEILSEVYGVGPNTKRVKQGYELLLHKLGSELTILQATPLAALEQAGGTLLAEGIRRVREGQVTLAAGYDGEYGTLKLFEPHERDTLSLQMALFAPAKSKTSPQKSNLEVPGPDIQAEPESADRSTAGWSQNELLDLAEPPTEARRDRPRPAGELILTGLNPQQQEAVLGADTHLLIAAGPGTGKTRTLTHRIAYLILKRDVAPENVLAITFTNKAAEEMVQRLTVLLGPAVTKQLTIKTFHAFGTALLRETGSHLGLSPNFSICSDADRPALLQQSCPNLNPREQRQALEQISIAKNLGLQAESPDVEAQFDQEFAEIYQAYQAGLQESPLLDFADLIGYVIELLENFPDIRQTVQDRFRWISVDEYQDINQAQYRLLRLLTGAETNLCAIGDPDQAIYGFRGADRRYFLTFTEDFPGARTLQLRQNYRSTQLILDASSQVISKSKDSRPVDLWTEAADSVKVDIYESRTDRAEAEYVVQQIESLIGGTSYFSIDSERVTDDQSLAALSFADFAVLYRLSAQSQPLIEAIQRSGIPYQTAGQTPLVDYKDVKTVLACLSLLDNPKNTLPLEQLVSKKQGQTIISYLAAIENCAIRPVQVVLEQIQQFLVDRSILSLDEKGSERLQQLGRRAVPFDNRLGEFLESIVLQKETDLYDPRADRVTMMTLHAAKGLEFPVVFIVGCEEGLLPYQRGDERPDIEEERRLFYVGMTRAQQRLIITHAKSRYLFGQQLNNLPSRFLGDIEQALKVPVLLLTC